MSRQELADSVNTPVTSNGGEMLMDVACIGKLECDDYRWPNLQYGEARRTALHAAGDLDLGFAKPHGV